MNVSPLYARALQLINRRGVITVDELHRGLAVSRLTALNVARYLEATGQVVRRRGRVQVFTTITRPAVAG